MRRRRGVAPPTFVLFTNVATEFHFSYERFLVNRLRETFGLDGDADPASGAAAREVESTVNHFRNR